MGRQQTQRPQSLALAQASPISDARAASVMSGRCPERGKSTNASRGPTAREPSGAASDPLAIVERYGRLTGAAPERPSAR
jgi:hypothetical protein